MYLYTYTNIFILDTYKTYFTQVRWIWSMYLDIWYLIICYIFVYYHIDRVGLVLKPAQAEYFHRPHQIKIILNLCNNSGGLKLNVHYNKRVHNWITKFSFTQLLIFYSRISISTKHMFGLMILLNKYLI